MLLCCHLCSSVFDPMHDESTLLAGVQPSVKAIGWLGLPAASPPSDSVCGLAKPSRPGVAICLVPWGLSILGLTARGKLCSYTDYGSCLGLWLTVLRRWWLELVSSFVHRCSLGSTSLSASLQQQCPILQQHCRQLGSDLNSVQGRDWKISSDDF